MAASIVGAQLSAATVHVVPSAGRPIIREFALKSAKIVTSTPTLRNSSWLLSQAFIQPFGWSNPTATVGLACRLFF